MMNNEGIRVARRNIATLLTDPNTWLGQTFLMRWLAELSGCDEQHIEEGVRFYHLQDCYMLPQKETGDQHA